MASRFQLDGDNKVLLRVTHSNIKNFSSEIRFDLEMSVEAAKEKLWKKCGTSVDSMHLVLYDDAGSKICDLSDCARPLGFYSPLEGFVDFNYYVELFIFYEGCPRIRRQIEQGD